MILTLKIDPGKPQRGEIINGFLQTLPDATVLFSVQ
jgi:hypothetical protein